MLGGGGAGWERSAGAQLPQRAQALPHRLWGSTGGFEAGQRPGLCSAGFEEARPGQTTAQRVNEKAQAPGTKMPSFWWLYLHTPVFAACQL